MMSTRLRRRADWGRGQNEDHRPCQPFQKPQLSALVPSLLIAQEASQRVRAATATATATEMICTENAKKEKPDG